MKRCVKKKILICILCIVFCLSICSPFIISYFYLPSNIKLIAGKEHIFNFEIPIKASVIKNQSIRIRDNANDNRELTSISLNKPFKLTMNEPGIADFKLSMFGIIPIKTVSVEAIPHKKVVPSGKIIGIRIDTKGVLVLGVGSFEVKDNEMASPCKGLLEIGDTILSANSQMLSCKEDLKDIVENSKGEKIKLLVQRGDTTKDIEITPIHSELDNEYKIGLWIRDSTQGIGTLTYYDPYTGGFGALGHGITDVDTKMLMPIKTGNIIDADITCIKKGKKGEPGEIGGIIDYEKHNILGEIDNNTSLGIYGKIDIDKLDDRENVEEKAVPVGFQDEVHEGKASIILNLTGTEAKTYDVIIQKVSRYNSEPAKGMVIKIVDPKLLDLTNGIVQGMSGSPIIQDGKLVGAVTHVFVHDPTKGYGIFIENMINNEK